MWDRLEVFSGKASWLGRGADLILFADLAWLAHLVSLHTKQSFVRPYFILSRQYCVPWKYLVAREDLSVEFVLSGFLWF